LSRKHIAPARSQTSLDGQISKALLAGREWSADVENDPAAGGDLVAHQPPRLQVLLVEDHPLNRAVIAMSLTACGVDLCMAHDGAEGVKAFASRRFDVVLMDIDMPVMDGLTATSAIRKLECELQMPRTLIAMLTAHTSAARQRAAQEAGADHYLFKPIEPEQLLSLINGVRAQDL
jgi:CheY-like chemotaxis protein